MCLPRARISRRLERLSQPGERTAVPVEFATSPDEYLGNGQFCFLNRHGDLAGGWQNPQYERLWLYNLHYFNYLNQSTRGRHASALGQLIDAWVNANPVGVGAGWEPYPLSLRIVSWIKWASTGQRLAEDALVSLYLQARYLAQRLEYHLLGNHLFANAKALVYAGMFFDTSEASGWLATGLTILRRELRRQVLDDGGHFELSPMYHAIFVEDLLDIVNLASTVNSRGRGQHAQACLALAFEPLPHMLAWLRVMTHPDGEIAQFNDAAFGIAQPLAVLVDYAKRLGVPIQETPSAQTLTSLNSSGYVRAACGDYVALLDIARIGPDYLPGHAHADTLSFELSLRGRRLIVDAGTSTYAIGAQRMSQRGTAAHNTVTYRAQSSSDVWSAFRVGRRAYPLDADMRVENGEQSSQCIGESEASPCGSADGIGGWTVSAAHTGYVHLPGRVTHRRTWHGDHDTLVIVDRLETSVDRAVTETDQTFATLRFAPGLDVTASAEGQLVVSAGAEILCHLTHTGSTARITDDFHHPRFGESIPCKLLRLTFLHATLVTRLSFRTSI
ncbi:MAG: alginate lyase family protein [Paraburkholderia sp.]|nr:MAG: alginate lyase family protein [Paraburkholderia sp.]